MPPNCGAEGGPWNPRPANYEMTSCSFSVGRLLAQFVVSRALSGAELQRSLQRPELAVSSECWRPPGEEEKVNRDAKLVVETAAAKQRGYSR